MKMKDTLEIVAKYLLGMPVYAVGFAAIALFVLSRIPEYNFITKYLVTLLLTH